MGAYQRKCFDIDVSIREERFTTLIKEKYEQFASWRNLISSLAEVEQGDASQVGYNATSRGHDLGKVHIASLRLDALKYRRTQHLVRRSGIDHWQIVLRRSGSEIISSGGKILRSVEGSLDLRSLAHPAVAHTSRGELICLWLNRDSLSAIAGNLDAASHKPIRGVMKNILQEYILTLERYRSTLTQRDVPAVVNSLTALLHAFIRPTSDTFMEAAVPITASRMQIARKFIDANIAAPQLGAAELCREMGVSRRKLYYMFEPCGGVSAFIRERRLAACHAALEDAADLRLVSTIAYDHGFSDAAQFSRVFKIHFGYSPRDVREFHLSSVPAKKGAPGSFAQWLLQSAHG